MKRKFTPRVVGVVNLQNTCLKNSTSKRTIAIAYFCQSPYLNYSNYSWNNHEKKKYHFIITLGVISVKFCSLDSHNTGHSQCVILFQTRRMPTLLSGGGAMAYWMYQKRTTLVNCFHQHQNQQLAYSFAFPVKCRKFDSSVWNVRKVVDLPEKIHQNRTFGESDE